MDHSTIKRTQQDLIPPQSGQPLHIDVDIMVFEVSKIDDITLSLTFELYFDLKWKETRLIINDRDKVESAIQYRVGAPLDYLQGFVAIAQVTNHD